MRAIRLGMVLAGFAAAAASPAFAQNVVADAEQIASVLRDAGYKAELRTDDEGDPYISSGSGGYSFAMFFYGCEAGRNCKSVQYYAGFDTQRRPDLEKMNEYARTKRWGRIYVDNSGDPAIEMDIDLEDGGMPPALFADNLEFWEAAMQAFADWAFAEFGETG